jgi:hypothetical protein
VYFIRSLTVASSAKRPIVSLGAPSGSSVLAA